MLANYFLTRATVVGRRFDRDRCYTIFIGKNDVNLQKCQKNKKGKIKFRN